MYRDADPLALDPFSPIAMTSVEDPFPAALELDPLSPVPAPCAILSTPYPLVHHVRATRKHHAVDP